MTITFRHTGDGHSMEIRRGADFLGFIQWHSIPQIRLGDPLRVVAEPIQTVTLAEMDIITAQLRKRIQVEKCVRCDTPLTEGGRCGDETCPFSETDQDDERGWAGHPDRG